MYSLHGTCADSQPASQASAFRAAPPSASFVVDQDNLPRRLSPEARAFLQKAGEADAPRLPGWLQKALDKFRADRLLSAAFLKRALPGDASALYKVELSAKTPARKNSDISIRLTALRESVSAAAGVEMKPAPLSPDLCRMENLKVAGELAAGVSHEIRNPMTAVRGFLQMLSNKESLRQYRPYFALMIEELDRANALITEYLSLAKNKRQPARPKSLCDVVKKMQPLLEASALMGKKTLRLALEPVPDLPLNDKEICQLLVNLAKNGFEAMEAGKTLTIGTRSVADKIVLFVRDEGCGIPAAVRERIGEPFFTTKESGTGLGLPICYALAKRNRAEIQVDSSETGTVFSVVFAPPSPDKAQAPLQ